MARHTSSPSTIHNLDSTSIIIIHPHSSHTAFLRDLPLNPSAFAIRINILKLPTTYRTG